MSFVSLTVPPRPARLTRALVGTALFVPVTLRAQVVTAGIGGQAIVALDVADPVPGGGTLTDLKLVQPVIMMRAAVPVWRLGGRHSRSRGPHDARR